MILTLSLPYTGNGALKRDYFQPVFQSEHQVQDRYVINQKYFASRDVLPSEFYKNNEIFKVVDQVQAKNAISYEDMLKLMPTTLSPTSDERLVAQALIDNAFRMFLTSDSARQLEVVKTFERVEKAMNTEYKLGETKEGVQQKLAVNYDFVTNSMKLDFTGSLDGQFAFSGSGSTLTISKKISSGAVGISHIENIVESKDIVTLSYNF